MSLASQAQGPASAEEVRSAFRELANTVDGLKVQRAMTVLAASPQTALPLFAERLRPVPPIDVKHVARLVGKLDSADFTVRNKANAELDKLGEDAWLLLREHSSPPSRTPRRLGRSANTALSSM